MDQDQTESPEADETHQSLEIWTPPKIVVVNLASTESGDQAFAESDTGFFS